MRIDLTAVLDPVAGTVSFSCPAGRAVGRWMGREPARTGCHDVEFDLPGEVRDLGPAAPGRASLVAEDGGVVVTGTVVALGGDADDPVVTIRVGTALILLELPFPRAPLAVGDGRSFHSPVLELHPYLL
ncbi:hypothetical protein [Kitasatospora sp. NPDC088134]|uniref:hypothetical protein n=1 Tax=Kitasatospora sp. NPDC088134 TaxID=3364071 RepID=UPI00380331B6